MPNDINDDDTPIVDQTADAAAENAGQDSAMADADILDADLEADLGAGPSDDAYASSAAEMEDLAAGGEEAPILERRDNSSTGRHKRAVFGVPVEVVIAVGRSSPTIGELMHMRRDTLLPLDSKIEDPVDIMIGKRVIARGELQELEDEEGRLGVRLTEIVDLAEPF